MKKQISRRAPSAPFLLLSLATCAFPACGKTTPPATASAVPATAAPQARILSYADFVAAEGGEGSALSSSQPESPLSEINGTVGAKPATKSDAACDAECAKHRQEFRYVVYVGKQIYAYWDLKKTETHTDFDALAHTFEMSIDSTTSMTGYYQILRQWAASFHDGHVNAMYKSDDSDYEVYTAPVRLEVLAPATDHEKVIVSQLVVAHGFSANQIDLQMGDEVLSINGVSAHQALDEAEKFTSGSTARMRRTDGVRRLVDVAGADRGAIPLVLEVQRPSEKPHSVTLYRTAELTAPGGSSSGDSGDSGESYFSAVVLPGSIGYLRIDAFEGSKDEGILAEAMKLLSHTQGLLIDVRRNGGGDQSGNTVLSRLTTSAITRYRSSPRWSDYTMAQRPYYFGLNWTAGQPFANWKEERVEAADAKDRYTDKPVVLLTGTDCFSACDTFTSALKTNRLATVVGEPTGGGTGQPLVFALPISGLSFRYSVVRGMTTEGKLIEGVGTQPDQLIERTQAERISNQDAQLIAALDVVARQIRERSTSPAAAQNEIALRAALRGVGPIWAQDADVSPSRSLDRALRRISDIDELEKR